MGQIGLQPSGTLDQPPSVLVQPSVRPNRAFVLIPVGGFLVFMAAISVYPPLDRAVLSYVGLLSLFGAVFLTSHLQRKSRRGEDVSSLLPMTYCLALAPAVLGLALWVNGGMDRTPIETHRQFVTRKFVSHGRHGISYHVEFTSWRSSRTTEQASVSNQEYGQLHVNDPVLVDLHKGALGVAWLGAVRRADSP
jgi:hypothetical protein